MSINLDIDLARESFRLQVQQNLSSSGLTGIFGPSGCGKTTLLRCIAGLEKVNGSISIKDQVWQSHSGQHWLDPSKRNIAYLFQEARLLPHLSVEDNIRFNLSLRKVKKTDAEINSVLEECGLSALKNQQATSLSGGQRQRACLARAVLCEPDLILMDEPLSALDAKSKREMLRLIQRIKSSSKTPILYVSHSIDEIAQLADDVMLMRKGEVLHLGPALQTFSEQGALFDHEQLASVFEATVTEIDTENLIAKTEVCKANTGEPVNVWIGEQSLSLGQTIRLRVTARDISLSLSANSQQSILNLLPVRIKTIDASSIDHSARIELVLGDNTLHALITKRSLRNLKLQPEQEVWAQVKALSVFD